MSDPISAAQEVLHAIACGVRDALRPPTGGSLYKIVTSKTIQKHAAQCFFLNGLIFITSIVFFEKVSAPIIRFLLADVDPDSKNVADLVTQILSRSYWVRVFFDSGLCGSFRAA